MPSATQGPTRNPPLSSSDEEGYCSLGEIMYESQVLPNLSQEDPDIRGIFQNLPLHNRLDLGRTDQNPLLVDEMSKELNLSLPKLILRELGIDPLSSQNPQ